MSIFRLGRLDDTAPTSSDDYVFDKTYTNDRVEKMISNSGSEAELPTTLRDAQRDVEVIIASFGLQSIRRYMDQHHWLEESRLARAADVAEPNMKLENVAAHSWHVAFATMLLAPNFPDIDPHRALELAILHDKLELFTGDFDPVGPDGQGNQSHAFDDAAQADKQASELEALEQYLGQLRTPMRERQRALLLETIHVQTDEARFVMAVDKLQALAFVLVKKAGAMTDEHLAFTLRYSAKAKDYFPRLSIHHAALVQRLLSLVAESRKVTLTELVGKLPAKTRLIAEAAGI